MRPRFLIWQLIKGSSISVFLFKVKRFWICCCCGITYIVTESCFTLWFWASKYFKKIVLGLFSMNLYIGNVHNYTMIQLAFFLLLYWSRSFIITVRCVESLIYIICNIFFQIFSFVMNYETIRIIITQLTFTTRSRIQHPSYTNLFITAFIFFSFSC